MDISNLTMGEIAQVEKLSGLGINSIENQDAPKGLALAALAFVIKRREHASFTWNAAQALTMPEVLELLGVTPDDEESTEAELAPFEEPAPAKSSTRKSRAKTD